MKYEKYLSQTGIKTPPSGIREFFDIVYTKPECISLGVGEPDFDTPWNISDSGIYSIKDGYTHYTPNRGLPELRDIITKKLHQSIDIFYEPDSEIIITLGVSQGLDLALRSLIDPGDEIIIVEPCYVSYKANVEMLYGRAVVVETISEENFQINTDRLEKAINSRTKAILLNYPSNPTGTSITKTELEKIAGIAIKHDLIVLSDEIYSHITYAEEHFSIARFPGMKERTIYLNGFSKSHAMTGWRLGYVCGPEFFISTMLKIHQYTALCAPIMSQYAAVEAIENGDKDVKRMLTEYTRRRNFIVNRFNEAGLPCSFPDGAFYVFPDITPTGLSSREFAFKLLEEKLVAVVPGDVFGNSGEGHIRCSYATSIDNIREALNRIEAFVKERPWES
ncbi:MAG: aminotransferase class I/II-fold pyridoxal phosphate-dependent enzyme [Leptospirales bacterium]|nr:aminotransferase class I/II-fold pyridoxal phosphate-dependent enzyme [Leptospirales bacterium]